MVGCSFAYSLVQAGIASELVLVDVDRDRAEGEAMDLNHGLPFVRPMTIASGDYEDLAGADVVVVTAGRNQKPGESRLDLVRTNIAVMEDVIPRIVRSNPHGVILLATNPVDILTEVAAEIAGLLPGRVLGTGTVLDTARFRFLLGEFLGVNPRSVHAYIVGEHGDTQVPVWSQANVAGLDLEHMAAPDGRRLGPAERLELAAKTRDAAYEIIKRKQATYYAIGLGILGVVEAILRDLKSALSVCAPINGLFGLEGVALSLPTIVGRSGAERLLDVPLSADERQALLASASTLRKVLTDARSS
jgi:L-lactate dehydrogenase